MRGALAPCSKSSDTRPATATATQPGYYHVQKMECKNYIMCKKTEHLQNSGKCCQRLRGRTAQRAAEPLRLPERLLSPEEVRDVGQRQLRVLEVRPQCALHVSFLP